jgi:branched-chain amino acid aminotransferase
MKPAAEAAQRGYSQVLWLFGENDEITEVGAMNVFFVLRNDNGTKEIITPPLGTYKNIKQIVYMHTISS